jgi:hypothetical protein
MDLFAKLSETYKHCETRTEIRNGINFFVIVNPFSDGNMEISNHKDEGITLCFPSVGYYHEHFDYWETTEECAAHLIERINEFLNGEAVVVGFFQGDIYVSSGACYVDELDMTSYESVAASSFCSTIAPLSESEQLEAANRKCVIRGWGENLNKDIEL